MTEHAAMAALTRTSDIHPLARNTATAMLTAAPTGALTVLAGNRLEPYGWHELARALDDVTTDLEYDLFHCQLGSRDRHELSRHLDGEFLTDVFDRDSDLYIAGPDWESEAYDSFDPDHLHPRLSPFGSSSLPALARLLAIENHMTGMLPLLLVDPAGARPYAGILARQSLIADPKVRQDACETTYEWLAADLAAFAAERPEAITVVASDERNPEWRALQAAASVVIPLLSVVGD